MQSKKILTAVLGAALVAGAPMAAAQTGDPELPGISPLPLSVATCNGLAGTIVGLTGDDTLDGTPGPDVIVGNGGDDTIRGKGGNDTICGGDGVDHITGGADDDTAFGEDGADKLKAPRAPTPSTEEATATPSPEARRATP